MHRNWAEAHRYGSYTGHDGPIFNTVTARFPSGETFEYVLEKGETAVGARPVIEFDVPTEDEEATFDDVGREVPLPGSNAPGSQSDGFKIRYNRKGEMLPQDTVVGKQGNAMQSKRFADKRKELKELRSTF